MDGLIEAQVPRLRRYARALTGDAVRADDLVKDTLERARVRRQPPCSRAPGTFETIYCFTSTSTGPRLSCRFTSAPPITGGRAI